ncbi:MAG: hypothetical protein M1814_002419 [Vezdaea aestivalis]|nr:MAG: hypothetical protein M1814_002419 [Vezdaea aestivalis]
MPYLPTSQEWFVQSALLLAARPESTRITTKYSLPSVSATAKSNPQPKASSAAQASEPPAPIAPAKPIATLTLKTYDPVSGACLKYKTDKAAEVGRLITGLGRLGNGMLGKEMRFEDTTGQEGEEKGDSEVTKVEGTGMPGKGAASGKGAGQGEGQQGGNAGGGGKKKKKGKK